MEGGSGSHPVSSHVFLLPLPLYLTDWPSQDQWSYTGLPLVMDNSILVPSMRELEVLSRIPRPDPLTAPTVSATEHIPGQMADFLNVLVVLSAPHQGSPFQIPILSQVRYH